MLLQMLRVSWPRTTGKQEGATHAAVLLYTIGHRQCSRSHVRAICVVDSSDSATHAAVLLYTIGSAAEAMSEQHVWLTALINQLSTEPRHRLSFKIHSIGEDADLPHIALPRFSEQFTEKIVPGNAGKKYV